MTMKFMDVYSDGSRWLIGIDDGSMFIKVLVYSKVCGVLSNGFYPFNDHDKPHHYGRNVHAQVS